tara:strand:+ start:520 stop:1395 length:876 start_codon:yes stop_codon:yes gene_type:complete
MNFYNIIKTLRPWQWVKNLIVFTVFFGAGSKDVNNLVSLLIVFFGLSFISSAGYVINDLVDKKIDINHPIKKGRPIASGSISQRQSLFLITTLLIVSAAIFLQVNFIVTVLGFTYVLLSAAYTYYLKFTKYFDSISISIMFLLRAYVGSRAVDIEISIYLFLFILTSSFMLGICKKVSILSNLAIMNSYKEYLKNNYSKSSLITTYKVCLWCSIFIYEGWLTSKIELYTPFIYLILFISAISLYYIFQYILKNSLNGKMEDISYDLFKSFPVLLNIVIIIYISYYTIYINN